jgi:hypothetical protein
MKKNTPAPHTGTQTLTPSLPLRVTAGALAVGFGLVTFGLGAGPGTGVDTSATGKPVLSDVGWDAAKPSVAA